jgi:FkbM family methyltransferase
MLPSVQDSDSGCTRMSVDALRRRAASRRAWHNTARMVRVRQTNQPPNALQLLAAAVMRGWIRSGWRGSTGGPTLLARYISLLHALPIAVPDGQYLYLDLRDGLSHRLLGGAPWAEAPWEPSEQEIMRRIVRPGDVVFDIGAHIGLHMVLLSGLTGEAGAVHAFEMNPSRLPSLRETVRHLPNVTLHEVGLADRMDRRTLYVPEDQSMASLADWTRGRVGPVTAVTADVQTLDAVINSGCAPLADFVKCDIEGGEMAVFKGGAALFDREEAPVILYEADARSTVAFGLDVTAATRVLRGFARAAYSFFWVHEDAMLQPIDLPGGPCENFSLVAVPAARRDRLSRLQLLD